MGLVASLIALLTLGRSEMVFAADDFDPSRPFLNRLVKQSKVDKTDFDYPFLFAQTAEITEGSYGDSVKKVRAFLARQQVPWRPGTGNKVNALEKVDAANLPLPAAVLSGKQLDGIRECRVQYCLMKLNTDSETPTLEAASDKVPVYQRLVLDRVKRFVRDRELPGYEHRPSNQEFVLKIIERLPFLKAQYPAAEKFLSRGLWKKEVPPKTFLDSFLRQELVVFGSDRLQPIHRISEVFEFEEGGSHLFFEVFIYTNHYFDSSLRTYEIKPYQGKNLLILSDALEIDELTKSWVVRSMFIGEMENAALAYQEDQLKQLRGSNRPPQ